MATTGAAKRSLPAHARRIPVPAAALGQWLAEIDDPAELKVTLRAVGLLAEGVNRGGIPPSLSLYNLLDDQVLRGIAPDDSDGAIRRALALALRRGTLAAGQVRGEVRILLNDAARQRYFEKAGIAPLPPDVAAGIGAESAAKGSVPSVTPAGQRANIFALYEQHIGTFGPNRAAELQAAEEEYPARWIEYAFATAAQHNARSWSYVTTILRRLVRDGLPEGTISAHDDGKPGIDSEANRRAEYLEQYRRLFGQLPWESGDVV